MNKVKIIALSGPINSGKNTVAELAVEHFGYKSLMLAGLAKSVVSQVYGISLEELENRKNKERYRPLIIEYAEKMKEIDLYVHCKYVYELIKKDLLTNSGGKYVISDIRWPYEYLYFHKFDRCTQHTCEIEYEGFKGYEVTYKPLYIESNLADKSSTHESESHHQWLKSASKGIIINNLEQRYSRDNQDLVNQLVKFV